MPYILPPNISLNSNSPIRTHSRDLLYPLRIHEGTRQTIPNDYPNRIHHLHIPITNPITASDLRDFLIILDIANTVHTHSTQSVSPPSPSPPNRHETDVQISRIAPSYRRLDRSISHPNPHSPHHSQITYPIHTTMPRVLDKTAPRRVNPYAVFARPSPQPTNLRQILDGPPPIVVRSTAVERLALARRSGGQDVPAPTVESGTTKVEDDPEPWFGQPPGIETLRAEYELLTYQYGLIGPGELSPRARRERLSTIMGRAEMLSHDLLRSDYREVVNNHALVDQVNRLVEAVTRDYQASSPPPEAPTRADVDYDVNLARTFVATPQRVDVSAQFTLRSPQYATDHAAEVIDLSPGSPTVSSGGPSPGFQAALERRVRSIRDPSRTARYLPNLPSSINDPESPPQVPIEDDTSTSSTLTQVPENDDPVATSLVYDLRSYRRYRVARRANSSSPTNDQSGSSPIGPMQGASVAEAPSSAGFEDDAGASESGTSATSATLPLPQDDFFTEADAAVESPREANRRARREAYLNGVSRYGHQRYHAMLANPGAADSTLASSRDLTSWTE